LIACRVTCRNVDSHRPPESSDHSTNRQSTIRVSGPLNTPNRNEKSSAVVGDEPAEESNSSESHTHSSSVTSNTYPVDTRPKVARANKMEELIKDKVLRHDPDVAELVFNGLSEILEYAPPDEIEIFQGSHEISELGLLELEAASLPQSNWEITECATSPGSDASSPPTTYLGQATTSSSSSVTQTGIGGSGSTNEASSSKDGPTQQIKTQRKSGASQSSKFRPFRCILNAIWPATFCARPEAPRFRTCTGPGWKNMQHVKYILRLFSRDSTKIFRDHVKAVHMKQVKKVGAFQCSICLDLFSDKDELQHHTGTVDCTPRCIECDEEFESKALRSEHQKLNHVAEEYTNSYMELDEKKYKKIKEQWDAFTKGKCQFNQKMENWIEANTPAYEAGRPDKTKTKSRNELGHWYVMYTCLAPGMKILEHPCKLFAFLEYTSIELYIVYDTATIPHSEMAEERILLINDKIVESRIEAHGLPPSDPNQQREWYRDALRDALRISAETRHIVTYNQPSAPPHTLSQLNQGPSPTQIQRPPRDLNPLNINSMSMVYAPPGTQSYSDMAFPQNYLPSAETMGTLTSEHNTLSNSTLIGRGMNNDWHSSQGVPENFQFSIDQMNQEFLFNDNEFGTSGSDILDEGGLPSNWTKHGQRHGNC
jgi:hypothetical protein